MASNTMKRLLVLLILALVCSVRAFSIYDKITASAAKDGDSKLRELRETCEINVADSCRNRGECKTVGGHNFCECKDGTSGDKCEVVDKCASDSNFCGTSEDVACVFDETAAAKAMCKCKDATKQFDKTKKVCIGVDCLCVNGRCVTDFRGKKKCICNPRHSQTDEQTCQPCDCGSKGKCIFMYHLNTKQYEKKCICDRGSAEKDGRCVDCHCGPNSKCEFEGEDKICYCEDGFSEKEGVCTECNCGEYGECKFENGLKTCNCYPGFVEDNGVCKECDCGEEGECLLSKGQKICKCNEGFQEYEGFCVGACKAGDCLNGGSCEDGNCKCPEHVWGIRCEHVDCNYIFPKCEATGGYCEYNTYAGGQICTCPYYRVFHPESQECEKKCDKDTCFNGGFCDETGVCKCKEHVSGVFCNVLDCDKIIPNCMSSGGKCVYESETKRQICDCGEDGIFHPESQQCEKSCDEFPCLNGGYCAADSSCKCSKYSGGVRCEKVDCEAKFLHCEASGGECVYDETIDDLVCMCKESDIFNEESELCQARNICEQDAAKEDCKGENELCVVDGDIPTGYRCDCKSGFVRENEMCREKTPCDDDERRKECENINAVCELDYNVDTGYICVCKPGYIEDRKTCRKGCSIENPCQNSGLCKDGACNCYPGTSGYFCEKIDDCDHLCLNVPDSDCTYDLVQKKATCLCHDAILSFDFVTKLCRKPCMYDTDCMNGARCNSTGQYHRFCKCLPGTSGDICDTINGCDDYEFRHCNGHFNASCVYNVRKGKAACFCSGNRIFDESLLMCRESCKEGDCQNGGLCMETGNGKICVCRKGTSGNFCETVDECDTQEFRSCINSSGTCIFDVTHQKPICLCKKGYQLNDTSMRCEACDCGKNAVTCSFKNGKKVCNCADDYSERNGLCEKLRCRENSCMGGKCEVVNGEEVCECPDGYILRGNHCRITNCTTTPCVNGTCVVRNGNKEKCVCPAGFTLDKGTCRKGVCRIGTCYGGRCEDIDGELVCVCPKGFHLDGIGCYETVCTIHRCFGGKCVVKDGVENCTCNEGYILVKDVCKKILCKKKSCFGGQCHIVDGKEECTCPDGYSIQDDVCTAN